MIKINRNTPNSVEYHVKWEDSRNPVEKDPPTTYAIGGSNGVDCTGISVDLSWLSDNYITVSPITSKGRPSSAIYIDIPKQANACGDLAVSFLRLYDRLGSFSKCNELDNYLMDQLRVAEYVIDSGEIHDFKDSDMNDFLEEHPQLSRVAYYMLKLYVNRR